MAKRALAHARNLELRAAIGVGTGYQGVGSHPKYVVASLVEEGGFGATASLYAVRDVLGAIYGEPDTAGTTAGDGAR